MGAATSSTIRAGDVLPWACLLAISVAGLAISRWRASELGQLIEQERTQLAGRTEVSAPRHQAGAPVLASAPEPVTPIDKRELTAAQQAQLSRDARWSDPQFRRLESQRKKAALDTTHRYFFAASRLGLDQIEVIKELLIKREFAEGDAQRALRLAGNFDRSAAREASDNAVRPVLAEIADTFSPQLLNDLVAFEATFPERNWLDKLFRKEALGEDAFSPEQANELAKLVSASRPEIGDQLVITESVVAASSRFLTPAQVASLVSFKKALESANLVRTRVRELSTSPK